MVYFNPYYKILVGATQQTQQKVRSLESFQLKLMLHNHSKEFNYHQIYVHVLFSFRPDFLPFKIYFFYNFTLTSVSYRLLKRVFFSSSNCYQISWHSYSLPLPGYDNTYSVYPDDQLPSLYYTGYISLLLCYIFKHKTICFTVDYNIINNKFLLLILL